MKQLLILLLTITLFTACNNNKGPRGLNGGGWSAAEKQKGLKMCMDEVAGKVNDDLAKKYCSCVLEKAMEKYPTYAAADAGTEEDGMKLAQACAGTLQNGGNLGGQEEGMNEGGGEKKGGLFGSGGGWSNSDKQRFMTECVPSAVNSGVDQQTANTFCDCTFKKIQKLYKSYDEAQNKMTTDALTTIQQECGQQGGQGQDDY